MKLNLLLIFFVLSSLFSLKAYEVPTSIQKKGILLEEFTGIHCGNCPRGHAIAKRLINAQKGVAYTIAIHAGYYANPGSDEPDFRTPQGEEINDEFEVTSYPSGTINRRPVSTSYMITGTNSWTKDAKAVNLEDAPVNLLMTSEYNGNNRELKVKVEGYYTLDVEEDTHYLNIAIVESNIQGPQSGGLVGDEYIHSHMFRGLITPSWGDKIEAPQKEQYFTKEYTYILPENINGVTVKPEDIELIAFVCAGKTDVLNVTGGKPEYINYERTLSATLEHPVWEMPSRYGYNFFEINVKNLSDTYITQAGFRLLINGNEQTAEWNGNIHSFETELIKIDVEPYDFAEQSNSYEIRLISLNGTDIEESVLSGTFNAPVEVTSHLTIEQQTDIYADENTFVLKDRNGNVLQEFGPYETNKKAVYENYLELEENEVYCYEIKDLWGDGLASNAYYKIFDDSHTMAAQSYEISGYGAKVFFRTTKPLSIASWQKYEKSFLYVDRLSKELVLSFIPSATGNIDLGIYTVSGSKVISETMYGSAGENSSLRMDISSLPYGMYLISILENGKKETLRFIIE